MTNNKHLTDEEIKKLANDIYQGLVFTNRHIQNPDDLSRVFMSLNFLDEEQIKKFNADMPGMIYEYMENAGPRSINGMPMFMSFRVLNREDAKKVHEKYIQIKKAVENA
jgi:hypothetical protein